MKSPTFSFASIVAGVLLFVLPVRAKDWLSINGAFPFVATNVVITQTLRTNANITTHLVIGTNIIIDPNLGTTNTVLFTNTTFTTNFTTEPRLTTNSTVFSNSVGIVFDMTMGNGKARATLTGTNLSPYTNFHFVVDGVTQATFTGNVRSNANLFFQNFPKGKDRLYLFPLNFDPRGKTLIISNGATFVTLTIGTPNQAPNLRYQESTDLTRLSGTGLAEMSYEQTKQDPTNHLDSRKFRVTLKSVAPGTHNVFVAGTFQGSIPVKSNKGEIVFKAPYGNNDQPLDFDPRGQLVEVRTATGTVLFSGVLRVPLVLSPAP